MGILDKLDQIVRAADVRPVRPADPADWPVLSEPLDPTPGESFDLGATVDDENLTAAGGYPENIPTDTSPIDPFRPKNPPSRQTGTDPDCACKDAKRPTIEWKSQRYTFTATDTAALVVTPSGADAAGVLCVTLVASVPGFRIGPSSNDAQAGGRLPASAVLQVYAGPVYIANPDGVAGTVDVFVEYEPT